MTKKLAIWSLLLALGGIAWLCYKGGDYFASKASVNLSSFTPIYCLIDCQFLCKNFESIESITLPKFNPHNVVIKRLPTYSNDRVLLTRIFAQTPEFIQCRVENAIITGFTGLAPPTINIKMALSPDINKRVDLGTYNIQLMAYIRVKQIYWNKQLQMAIAEVKRAEKIGTLEQIKRAKERLSDISKKASLMSGTLPVRGQGNFCIESTSSSVIGVTINWISIALKILAWIFSGATLLLCSLYLWTLKAGDIEP